MTECDAYLSVGEGELGCTLRVDHLGYHLHRTEHIICAWDEAEAEYWRPMPGPRLPHVCSDRCQPLHQALRAYMGKLTDNVFSAKPLLLTVSKNPVLLPTTAELEKDKFLHVTTNS